MPPLPQLCNPEIFIWFHDAIDNPDDKPSQRYNEFRTRFRGMFASLAKYGDVMLKLKWLDLLQLDFGRENTTLVNIILDKLVSNEVSRDFAMAYNLHSYVGLPPRISWWDKWGADLWEAYWGALFRDRELWNDDEQELTTTLHCLLYLFAEDAYSQLKTTSLLDMSIQTQNPESLLTDDECEELINPEYLNVPSILKTKTIGYRIKRPPLGIICFSQEQADAKNKFHYYHRATLSISPPPPSPFFHSELALHPLSLPLHS